MRQSFPRCGADDETINHAIFECPPSLQTWVHAATPTPPPLFLTTSHYANIDYFFWRKNDIEDPELDKDPYPWIMWYIWKARNDKLFRGIDRVPLELSDMLNQNVMLGLKLTTNKRNKQLEQPRSR